MSPRHRRRREMASKRMDFSSFVGKLLAEEDTDVLREGVRVLAQALMDAEVSTQIGAELYERTDSRTAQRNGYRTRIWDTRVGTVELRVPKVVPGTYFPSLLEPRRRAERALAAGVQGGYVKGSTPTCGWTLPSTRSGRAAGWCRWPRWSRWA